MKIDHNISIPLCAQEAPWQAVSSLYTFYCKVLDIWIDIEESGQMMKLHRIRPLTLTLAVFIVGCSIREQEREYRGFFNETAKELVPGLRLPDESQYGPAWAFIEGQSWETRDGSGETKAEFWTSGEFNGDGATDYAYILVEEATGTRTLFAFVSSPETYEARQLLAGFKWGTWLRTLPPGTLSSNQSIELFRTGEGTSTFVWDETTQGFIRHFTSD